MNNKTQLNQPIFRALNGLEAANYIAHRISSVVPEEIAEEVKEYILDGCRRSGRFEHSASYPVAKVRLCSGGIVVKVLPAMTLPKPFLMRLNFESQGFRVIGIEDGVGVRCVGRDDEVIPLSCDIGMSVENAPDKIREMIGEAVLVPQKVGDRIINRPKGESHAGQRS